MPQFGVQFLNRDEVKLPFEVKLQQEEVITKQCRNANQLDNARQYV